MARKKILSILSTVILILLLCVSMAAAEPEDEAAEPVTDDPAVSSQPVEEGSSEAAGTEPEQTPDTTTDPDPLDSFVYDYTAEPEDTDAGGTEGDELQVFQNSHVEIYLGVEYKGLEFTLETEDGEYPDSVVVDNEGKIVMDVGGGGTYTLRSTGEYAYSGSVQDSMEESATDDTEDASLIPTWAIVIVAVAAGLLMIVLVVTIRQRSENARFRFAGTVDTPPQETPEESEKKDYID